MNWRSCWALVLYWLLWGGMGLFAQQPAFYSISTEQGLPSTEVYRILQDPFGYLWIGSEVGLIRYDGFAFDEIHGARQNGRAISFLQMDGRGRLWAKNFYGQVFYTSGDSLCMALHIPTSDPSEPHFALDGQSQLWIVQGRELQRCTDAGDVVERIALDALAASESIVSLKYLDGKLYGLSKGMQLFCYDLTLKQLAWKHWEWKPKGDPTTSSTFFSHQGRIYLLIETVEEGLRYWLLPISTTAQRSLEIRTGSPNKRVYGVFSSGEFLWMHTAAGAWCIDPLTGATLSPPLFADHLISSMFRDGEGMYWFASLDDGLKVVPQPSVTVIDHWHAALDEDAVTCVAALKDSTVLFGNYQGQLYKYDPRRDQLLRVWDAPRQALLSTKTIYETDRYTLISRGRLCVVDHQTGRQSFPALSNIRDMALRGDSIVLVFPNFIIALPLERLFGDLDYVVLHDQGGKEVEYDPIHDLLFFSVSEGVGLRDGRGKWSPLTIQSQPVHAAALSYADGIMWVGTIDNGIWGFEGDIPKFHFDKTNLLKENEIRVLKATNGQLWAGTARHLYRIDLEGPTSIALGQAQSIPAAQIKGLDLLDGRVYLATAKGLISFPADIAPSSGRPPSIQWTAMEVNQRSIPISSSLQLSSDVKSFKARFSSVALASRGGLSYRYRIRGVTDIWVPLAGDNPEVLLSPPPVGRHSLEIQALNPVGPDSDILQIELDVALPFVQRWWFLALSGLVLIGLVSLMFMLRIRAIRRRADLLNRLVASQLSTLKSQMNPHFLFNTLTSLQDLILEKDTKGAVYYLSKFSKLLRNILDYSSRERITLAEELEMLGTYLELQKLRLGDAFAWEIDASEISDPQLLTIPPMLVQPFVENGLNHGLLHKHGQKRIKLKFWETDVLWCTVEDNGIGRKHAEEIQNRNNLKHRSFATGAMQRRIDLLNSNSLGSYAFQILDLEQDGKPSGTRVEIRIPLQFTNSN